MLTITDPAMRVWCGFFVNDFGDEENIIFAPEDVLERWQYFVNPEIQYRIWEQENMQYEVRSRKTGWLHSRFEAKTRADAVAYMEHSSGKHWYVIFTLWEQVLPEAKPVREAK